MDDADYQWLSKWKWHAVFDGHNWYAARKKNGKQFRMHNAIKKPRRGIEIDHKDGDGLNNCRSNLRNSTHRQNMRNRSEASNNKSGFKGVCWHKRDQEWRAQITVRPIVKMLGRFDDKIEAAKAYDKAAVRIFGRFAVTNESMGKFRQIRLTSAT